MVKRDPRIKDIVQACKDAGGRAILVGGAVRDYVMGLESKDWDIEIYGLDSSAIESLLSRFGTIIFVGKSFGVFRIVGLDVDFSLPRRDSYGRKPEIAIDPHMSYYEAFMRRDLTMNAMGIDLVTHELIDPFNGQKDIKNKILRTPNPEFFVQDPLRFFRVMQFIGRFGMQPDDELNRICISMNISHISIERIVDEIEKLFLRSQRPSLGLRWIAKIGRMQEVFPELFTTIGVPQRPDFHPEGDVFEHSMQTLDAAAVWPYESDDKKLVILFAALCHDLGKATTTQLIDGVYKSFGHADAGVPFARQLLKKMTLKKEIHDAVSKLVKYHMEPILFIKGGAKALAYKRLALKLAPESCLHDLAVVSKADRQGRNGDSKLPLTIDIPQLDQFVARAKQHNVLFAPEKAILQGRDILHLKLSGPEMGRLLKKAYEIQIEQGIEDKQELLDVLIKV